jgi:hypothetical protein
MLLLNFAHPLTAAHLARVGELAGRSVERVIAVPAQFDHAAPFVDQVRSLLAAVGFTADEWQTTPVVVNLPSLSPIAGVLLADLHGRTGHFPTVVRLRPVADSTPPQFEVAELVNLQVVRDAARVGRGTG